MEQIAEYFLKEGLLGAICVGLAGAYWFERKKADALQEARVEELKASIAAQNNTATALTSVSEAVKTLTQEIRFAGKA